MADCKHEALVLLNKSNKLRCRHCHLTISEGELEKDYCPECLEENGVKRYDFEPYEADDTGSVHYACEKCGQLIELNSDETN
jgi:hypothetical protein